MTKLDAILRDARMLSPDERVRLLAAMIEESAGEADADLDHAAGQRGLTAWTESVQGEDWSPFYPEGMGNGRSSSA
jgi:hypothetical protein